MLFSKPLLTAPNFDVSVNYVNLSLLSELVAKAIVNDKTLNLIDQMDLQGELSAHLRLYEWIFCLCACQKC